ncbi:MAG: glycosyltransferase family 8 protein [Muribaculaceae bacterium]|nr:glycosyltransferase family 8 protein [Muribaculaceae bacterium]
MIHIACNIDSNYVKYCAVTIVSLFENNRNKTFSIHIIADGLSDKEKSTLTNIAQKYGNSIFFYSPDMDRLKGFSINRFSKRISLATYYRCILSDILPESIDRVLYLDCDIIILGDILPFWQTSLDNIGVAAIEDVGYNDTERYKILCYPKEASYFNAGVLLINLDYWRKHDMASACINYYHKYPERILYNDQDLLNSILYKDKKLVDLRWNVQDGFYRNPKAMTHQWKNKFAGVLKHPIILHYTNRKPWEYDSQHPLRNEYFKYLALTPFKDDIILNNPIYRIKRFFRLLPFSIGLRRQKYIRMSDL